MDEVLLNRIIQRIDSYQELATQLQQELTSRPALGPENGGDGESEKAHFLASFLEEQLRCDDLDHYNAPDARVASGFRPNIVARIRGQTADRTLWVMSHMDVVPAVDLEKWHGDPWQTHVIDGKIYGRGTEDNQQAIVSSLLAAKAFRDENVVPKVDIALLLVSDEETGSKYGLQYVLSQKPNLLDPNDLILIPDSGNGEGSVIEVAEKGILWLKMHVTGKTTHPSTPQKGINALNAAANLIIKLNNLYVIFTDENTVFDPPKSTFEPTRMDQTVGNINTVPGEVTFYLDCRLLPNVDPQRVLSIVRNACNAVEQRYKVKINLSTEQEVQANATSAKAPVVRALENAITGLRGIRPKPIGIGGGTVASFLRSEGLPVAVWATQDETLHGPDEYAKIDNILADAKVFAHLALQNP